MPKFCIHEQHAGVCEKTGGYCSEGPCPYEEMVDYAPVVHGRWQSYESSRYVGADDKGNPKYRNIRIYYCSQCGHCSIIRTKGCPNCRAKMDKEETNELDKREG